MQAAANSKQVGPSQASPSQASPNQASPNQASPKEKVLATAARLFFERGYQATGVDAIAAASGVGKMTLYRHYPSKDDLIVAYLRQSDDDFWAHFEASTAGANTARGKLLGFFTSLQAYVLSPGCYGCPFINLAGEFPAPTYPGHAVAVAHKQAVRARFLALATATGAAEPVLLADALLLLMDATYMAARMYGPAADSPAHAAADAARRLLDAHGADVNGNTGSW